MKRYTLKKKKKQTLCSIQHNVLDMFYVLHLCQSLQPAEYKIAKLHAVSLHYQIVHCAQQLVEYIHK